MEDVEAARRRVEEQRLAEAKRIRVEQLWKCAQGEVQELRQRAADLEHKTAEHVTRLLQQETAMEMDEEGELEEDVDGDQFEIQSNGYTPTEVYSDDDDQPRWSSPFPSPSALAPVPSPAPRSPRSRARDVEDRSHTQSPRLPPQLAGPSSLQLSMLAVRRHVSKTISFSITVGGNLWLGREWLAELGCTRETVIVPVDALIVLCGRSAYRGCVTSEREDTWSYTQQKQE